MNFKVVEKFVSINGEGVFAGELAVFIRFAGCNLSCSYCDTKWANELNVAHELATEFEIYDYIKSTGISRVTITGGEPLIQDGIRGLLELLAADDTLQVEIETNGSVSIKPFLGITPNPPNFTMDYKLISSDMEDQMNHENFKYLKKSDTVKFVVGSTLDLKLAKEIIYSYKLPELCNVHLSTVFGKIEAIAVVDFLKENAFNGVRIQPQLHKIIWNPSTRGV